MSHTIDIEGLCVRYKNATRPALDHVSIQIREGSYFGLLGPNGAGKTSLISFLCGQVSGEYKKAVILGADRLQLSSVKNKLGYAPQEVALYPTLSGRENLKFFAKLMDVGIQEVDRVLEWVDLTDRANDKIMNYSGGMKRRLNLGVALLNNPQLLILDEPTVGVDPQSRNFIFERLLELKKKNVTLIYSTHYLEEVKTLCSDVGILNEGKVIANGPISQVLGNESLEKKYLELTGTDAG